MAGRSAAILSLRLATTKITKDAHTTNKHTKTTINAEIAEIAEHALREADATRPAG